MRKTKYHIKKKIMPLLLAVAMAGTATPIYVAHPAIVKAAVSNAFGTNKISLSAGSYTVPVSLKKADNVEQNSMAAGAVGKNATLEVAEDGTASLEVELKALNLYGMTGAAKDLKVYQGNDIKSETKDVTVEETDEAGNPTKIKFTISESVKTTDGIYLHMTISPMGMGTDAFLKVDYASLKGNENVSDGTKENTIHIAQFGGYDIKTTVTYKDGKVTDLQIKGENFEGKAFGTDVF